VTNTKCRRCMIELRSWNWRVNRYSTFSIYVVLKFGRFEERRSPAVFKIDLKSSVDYWEKKFGTFRTWSRVWAGESVIEICQ